MPCGNNWRRLHREARFEQADLSVAYTRSRLRSILVLRVQLLVVQCKMHLRQLSPAQMQPLNPFCGHNVAFAAFMSAFMRGSNANMCKVKEGFRHAAAARCQMMQMQVGQADHDCKAARSQSPSYPPHAQDCSLVEVNQQNGDEGRQAPKATMVGLPTQMQNARSPKKRCHAYRGHLIWIAVCGRLAQQYLATVASGDSRSSTLRPSPSLPGERGVKAEPAPDIFNTGSCSC